MSGLDLQLVGVGKALNRIAGKAARLPVETHLACLRGAHVLEGSIKLHIRHNPHMLVYPDRRGQSWHEGLIDTGAMLNSVSVNPIRNGAEVGPRTEYAAYLEYGRAGSSATGSLDGEAGHVAGMRAFPFMQPALDEKRAEVERMVKKAVEDELRR